MQILTILQFISAFGAYCFLTMLLPALVFHRRFRGERIIVRFFFYFIIGNFFFINLVFLLQLLRISNRFTLTVCTLLSAGYGAFWNNGTSIKESIAEFRKTVYKVMSGTLGYRLIWNKIWNKIKKEGKLHLGRISISMKKYFWDWVLTAVVTIVLFWMYGTNLVENMGYNVSDIPVHNYWINAMGDGLNNIKNNQIFVKGIYPFGFHCMIYFIHTVFGMKTYVLLRVFGLVQTLFIHYVLLAFLRGCCKTRYMAYGAIGIFILASFWGENTYIRYYSTLPQEFGMIFILPSIYFLYIFFDVRKKEVQGILKNKSMRYLFGFAMSFSLTLSVHFYDTIVAGILCLGIAAGYGFRLFRKQYFGRVLLTGIISVFIAVLPMGIAFATGTPLEGSLRWGMSIIKGSQEEDVENTATDARKDEESTATDVRKDEESTATDAMKEGENTDTDAIKKEEVTASDSPYRGGFGQKSMKLLHKLKEKAIYVAKAIRESLKESVIPNADDNLYRLIFLSMGITVGFGILCLLGNDKDYGAKLFSAGFGIFLLLCMLSAGKIGIPQLLDQNRCSIYTAYLLPILLALANDALTYTLFGWIKSSKPMNILSLLATVSWIMVLFADGKVRVPVSVRSLETNGAVTCLTNILEEHQVGTFTVCSANDELRMVEDYGYFYEMIHFLRNMEGQNVDGNLTIPTKYVYFFIEKVPIDYTVPYDRSGQIISEEGAANRLPVGNGLSVYQAEKRWIVMSRMYYWAERFQNLYKNEMKIYYESDDFICYQVEQNPYRLFDFSIDYGYNTMFR